MNSVSDRPRIRRRSRGERRVTYALKVLALVSLAAYVLSASLGFFARIGSVCVIVVGAVFFTYAIYPLVKRLNERVPLVWSIVLVYAAIAVVAGFGIAVVVPALADDVQSLAHGAPAFVQHAQAALENPHDPVVRRLPPVAREYFAKIPAQIAALAERYGVEGASSVLTFVLSFVALAATVVVIPVMSAYLMIETPALMATFFRVVPPKWRGETRSIVHDLDAVLGGFIRGQLLVGAVIGTCITIALLVLHVKYAVLIGVAAGLFDVIPYVGSLVGFVPAVTLALFNDGWQHALLVAFVFVVIFQLEGHFIAPKIVSDSVGLSPLLVIVAILVGGELLGIAGMFVAVPIAGALRVLALHALPRARAPVAIAPVPVTPVAVAPVVEGPTSVAPPPSVASPPEKARGARA